MKSKILDEINSIAKEVYKNLGTGHNEIIYHRAFEVELRTRNIDYSTKAPLSIYYKGYIVGYSELDIIVYPNADKKEKIIVELKATTYEPRSAEKAQLCCYMRSMNCEKGILINFPQPTSKLNIDIDDIHFIHFGFDVVDDINSNVTNTSVPILHIN